MTARRKRSLVIVESPAKAKTLNKILESGYVVKACMGHVRDLPTTTLGIKVEENFKPNYRIIKGKSAVIKELRAATKGIDQLYLATDPDREGEAIAWHLHEALGYSPEKTHRVAFNEITKRAVLDAFKHPGTIAVALVNAQQARRILDRIVGYKISPLLWKKIGRGLSAGRVQSVAVRLVVDREKEIAAFKAEEYWEIDADLRKDAGEGRFQAELKKIDGNDFKLSTGDSATALVDALKNETFVVSGAASKERKVSPPPPFTTSLLQQHASKQLGFSTKRTMRIAQQLYEGVELGSEGSVGMITYMRTDSFRVAEEAIVECREAVRRLYGDSHLVEAPRRYASKKGAQDAHEAIRPTGAERTPDGVKAFLTSDQYRLYRLIWRRFIATQMTPAVYRDTTISIVAGKGLFQAKGIEVLHEGYAKAAGLARRKDDQILPPVTQGETLTLEKLIPSQHFTQPPPRFGEASLVKALESFGIGRPSTYAPIISTIQERGYVRQEEKRLFATELGIMVTEKLVQYFDDIMNTDFTARMEERLDLIEESKAEWVDVLREFYTAFAADLERATASMVSVKESSAASGEVCPVCGKPMLVRWNRYGKFLGCSGFPECKTTKSLDEPPETGEKCEKCGKAMVVKSGRRGRFIACSGYPDCKNTRSLGQRAGAIEIPPGEEIICEKCGKTLIVRYGRRGPFMACPGYPECKNTKPIPAEWRKKRKDAATDAPEPPEQAPESDDGETSQETTSQPANEQTSQ